MRIKRQKLKQCPNCESMFKIVMPCSKCEKMCCVNCSIEKLCINCYVNQNVRMTVNDYFRDKYTAKVML